MIWWPFAPKPERADTLEVTDLHSDAPPLYSTVRNSGARISTAFDTSIARLNTSIAIYRLTHSRHRSGC